VNRPKKLPVEYPTSYLTQTRLLLWRAGKKLWRDRKREFIDFMVGVRQLIVYALSTYVPS
jgi:hypothetical protein